MINFLSFTNNFLHCVQPITSSIDAYRAKSNTPANPTWGRAINSELEGRLVYGAVMVSGVFTLLFDLTTTTLNGFLALAFSVLQSNSSDYFYGTFYQKKIEVELSMRLVGSVTCAFFSLRSIFQSIEATPAPVRKHPNPNKHPILEIRSLHRLIVSERKIVLEKTKSHYENCERGFFGIQRLGISREKSIFPPCCFAKEQKRHSASRLEALPGCLYSLAYRATDFAHGIVGGLSLVFTLNLYKDRRDLYSSFDPSQVTQIFSSPILLVFDLLTQACQFAKPQWSSDSLPDGSPSSSKNLILSSFASSLFAQTKHFLKTATSKH